MELPWIKEWGPPGPCTHSLLPLFAPKGLVWNLSMSRWLSFTALPPRGPGDKLIQLLPVLYLWSPSSVPVFSYVLRKHLWPKLTVVPDLWKLAFLLNKWRPLKKPHKLSEKSVLYIIRHKHHELQQNRTGRWGLWERQWHSFQQGDQKWPHSKGGMCLKGEG